MDPIQTGVRFFDREFKLARSALAPKWLAVCSEAGGGYLKYKCRMSSLASCAFFTFIGFSSVVLSETPSEYVEREKAACEAGDVLSCWSYSIILLAEDRFDELQVIQEKLCDQNFRSSCQDAAEGLSLSLPPAERSARLNRFCKNGISGCAGALKSAKGDDRKFFENRLRDQCESLANSEEAHEGCRLYAARLYKNGNAFSALHIASRVCTAKHLPSCETRAGILHLMGRAAEAEAALVAFCPKARAGQSFELFEVPFACKEVSRGLAADSTAWIIITKDLH